MVGALGAVGGVRVAGRGGVDCDLDVGCVEDCEGGEEEAGCYAGYWGEGEVKAGEGGVE